MSLVLGQQMLREQDGRLGVVILTEQNELRIAFQDRGERLIADKKEKWVVAEPPPGPLRLEEIFEVARAADQTLKAIDKHLPNRAWLTPKPDAPPHDKTLFDLIVTYLRSR